MKLLKRTKTAIWRYLFIFLNGCLMVISDIIPGFSGGIALTITGMLKKVWSKWELILKPKQKGDRKKAILFYVFFILGAAAGTLGFAQVVNLLLLNAPSITFWLFLILAFGSTIIYWQENRGRLTQRGTKRRIRGIISLVMGMCFLIGIAVFAYVQKGRLSTEDFKRGDEEVSFDNVNIVILIHLAGFLSAAAMVTPGMSGALVIISFGVYSNIYSGIYSNPAEHPIMIFTYIGSTILGTVTSIFVLDKIYKKFTYSVSWFFLGTIITSGFVMIFLFKIWIPQDPIRWIGIACSSLFGIGSIILVLKINKKRMLRNL